MGLIKGFKCLSAGAMFVVVLWLLVISGFYTFAAYQAGTILSNNKTTSAERHAARMSEDKTEAAKTSFDLSLIAADAPVEVSKVRVGIYLDRVIGLSTKSTDWTADFYVWFRWKDKDLDPGNSFQVIGGEILSKNEITAKVKKENGDFYSLYRVTARITKFFNIMRYPLDNHMLTIHIEEEKRAWHHVQYVPDVDDSKHSSRVKIPGYMIDGDPLLVVKPHAYKSDRGDPTGEGIAGKTYSQFIYGLDIKRPDWGLYFKMFQGLFASVAIAFLAFLFYPTSGERISLGVGAFFASVASSNLNLRQIPGVSMVTMTDMMNGIAMATIFLSLWASVISARLAANEQYIEASKKLDTIMLTIFVIGYVTANVVIALSASVI